MQTCACAWDECDTSHLASRRWHGDVCQQPVVQPTTEAVTWLHHNGILYSHHKFRCFSWHGDTEGTVSYVSSACVCAMWNSRECVCSVETIVPGYLIMAYAPIEVYEGIVYRLVYSTDYSLVYRIQILGFGWCWRLHISHNVLVNGGGGQNRHVLVTDYFWAGVHARRHNWH